MYTKPHGSKMLYILVHLKPTKQVWLGSKGSLIASRRHQFPVYGTCNHSLLSMCRVQRLPPFKQFNAGSIGDLNAGLIRQKQCSDTFVFLTLVLLSVHMQPQASIFSYKGAELSFNTKVPVKCWIWMVTFCKYNNSHITRLVLGLELKKNDYEKVCSTKIWGSPSAVFIYTGMIVL